MVFLGAGEKGNLFLGSLGTLVIILGSWGASTYFWRFREHCQKTEYFFRDLGRLEHYFYGSKEHRYPPPPVGPFHDKYIHSIDTIRSPYFTVQV